MRSKKYIYLEEITPTRESLTKALRWALVHLEFGDYDKVRLFIEASLDAIRNSDIP